MKKILSFFAAGLLLASCSNDDFAPAVEGQEQEVSFSIELPQNFQSRAGGSNSALGAVANCPDQALAFHAALYYVDAQGNAVETAAWHNTIVAEAGANKVTFKPTLVIGETYKLVAYASYDQSIDWAANEPANVVAAAAINDETKDAYFVVEEKTAEAYMSATLKRPYGKLRIITNDWTEALNQFNATDITNVEVTYNEGRQTELVWDLVNDAQEFAAVTETTTTLVDNNAAAFDYSTESGDVKTLMVDYIAAPADGTAKLLNLVVTVTFDNNETFTREFNMDVPVKRNYLTTLTGDFFTSTAQLDIEVDDAFANEEEINYNFYKAFQDGGYYKMEGDVTLTSALSLEAGKTLVLDLNGKTITMAAPADGSVNDLKNYGNLTLINGKIVAENNVASRRCVYNYGEMVIDGTEFVQQYAQKGAAINNEGKMTIKDATVDAVYYSIWNSGADAQLVIDGGKFTTTNDVEIRDTWSYCVICRDGAQLAVNGGEFQANHGVIGAESGSYVTLNAGKYHCTAEYTGNSDWTLYAADATILYSSACEFSSNNPSGYKYADTNGVIEPFTAVDAETTLAEALAAVSTMEKAVITLDADATWTTGAGHGTTPFIAEDAALKDLVIDGRGVATLTAVGQGVGAIRAANGGSITFKNLKVVDNSVSYAENNWELGYLEFAGNLKFENCEFVNAIMACGETANNASELNAQFVNCTFNSNAAQEYDVWVSGGSASFTGCKFLGYRGLKMHEAYGSDIDQVIVDGNDFGPLSKKPGIAIGDVNASTIVKIVNNTFVDCQAGDQGLFIYETDTDVSTFQFTCENNYVANNVNTSEALNTAIANGVENIVLANGTYEGVFDLTGKTVNLIAAVGANPVINGLVWVNNTTATIKGLTLTNTNGAQHPNTSNSQYFNTINSQYPIVGAYLNAKVKFEDCTFNLNGPTVYGYYGYAENEPVFEGCVFNCNGIRPIANNGPSIKVSGCEFNDQYQYAVRIFENSGEVQDVEFVNNVIQGTTVKTPVEGINISKKGSTATILGNFTIKGNTAGLAYRHHEKVTMSADCQYDVDQNIAFVSE